MRTEINNIDIYVARLLGLSKTFVNKIVTMTEILMERRLSRAEEARPEAIIGEEEARIRLPPKRKKEKERLASTPLDKWI